MSLVRHALLVRHASSIGHASLVASAAARRDGARSATLGPRRVSIQILSLMLAACRR